MCCSVAALRVTAPCGRLARLMESVLLDAYRPFVAALRGSHELPCQVPEVARYSTVVPIVHERAQLSGIVNVACRRWRAGRASRRSEHRGPAPHAGTESPSPVWSDRAGP